jgi:hypothetical protein
VQNAKSYLVVAAAAVLFMLFTAFVLQRTVVAQMQATLVKDVDNPARQPFSAECMNYTAEIDGCTLITVPAGQRLVIEMFEVRTQSAAPVVSLLYTGIYHYFTPDPPVGVANLVYSVRRVRYYADPGTKIVASSFSANSINTFGASYVVSGYFVTLP